jgi:hypothetical protein
MARIYSWDLRRRNPESHADERQDATHEALRGIDCEEMRTETKDGTAPRAVETVERA